MFRKTSRTFLAALIVLGAVAFAATQEPKQAEGGQKQITNSIGMKLTLIPAGEYKRGGDESMHETATFFAKNYGERLDVVKYAFESEYPQHRVRITKPFYLGTYHVTRGQFARFVKDSGYKTNVESDLMPGAEGWSSKDDTIIHYEDRSWRNAGFEQTDEHPVVNVSWRDAVAFCEWLSRKEGKTYRLPTEAEWEYACRAGTTTRYSSGDDPETLAKVANVADATFRAKFPKSDVAKCAIKASDGYVYTSPVGQFNPNAFGLYDMHGNAWQLCADRYGKGCYSNSPADDPRGSDTGTQRVARGGSWLNGPAFTRSAVRGQIGPAEPRNDMGFRVIRVAE